MWSIDVVNLQFIVILCNIVCFLNGAEDQAKDVKNQENRAWSPVSDINNSFEENSTISTKFQENMTTKTLVLDSITNNPAVHQTLESKQKPTSEDVNDDLQPSHHIAKKDGFSMKRKLKLKKKKNFGKKNLMTMKNNNNDDENSTIPTEFQENIMTTKTFVLDSITNKTAVHQELESTQTPSSESVNDDLQPSHHIAKKDGFSTKRKLKLKKKKGFGKKNLMTKKNNNNDDENSTIPTEFQENMTAKTFLPDSMTNNTVVYQELKSKQKPISESVNDDLQPSRHIAEKDGFLMKRKLKLKKKKGFVKKNLMFRKKSMKKKLYDKYYGEIKVDNMKGIYKLEEVTKKLSEKDNEGDVERETKTTTNILRKRNYSTKHSTMDDIYDLHYLNPHHISNQLRFISDQFSEDNITIEQEMLGKTHQHKDIIMLKITEKVIPQQKMRFHVEENIYGYTSKAIPEKKIMFIVHGLSVMNIRSVPCLAVTQFLEELMILYFEHLAEFDIFLIPMANPDGVAQKKSYWNKNMSPQKTCPGVALDRNFEISWSTRRNMSSCSQQYPGPSPFSEPETRAVRSVFQRYGHRIAAFLNLHPGSSSAKIPKGNAILYPKGYELQSLDKQYDDLKRDMQEVLNLYTGSVTQQHIAVDTLHKWHGKVAGTSVDYASLVYRTPVSLELVMRPYKHNKVTNLMDESLTEVWAPALEVIFEFVKKTTKKKSFSRFENLLLS